MTTTQKHAIVQAAYERAKTRAAIRKAIIAGLKAVA